MDYQSNNQPAAQSGPPNPSAQVQQPGQCPPPGMPAQDPAIPYNYSVSTPPLQAPPPPAYAAPPKPLFTYEKADTPFALIALLLGFFFVHAMFFSRPGLAAFVFTLFFA